MSFLDYRKTALQTVLSDSSRTWSDKFAALLNLAQVENAQARKDLTETLVDLYEGDQMPWLDSNLYKTYKDTKNMEKIKEWYNMVKLIVDKISVVYDSQATRELINVEGGKEPSEKENELFNAIKKNCNWHETFQKVNTYTNLCGECLVRVYWFAPKQEIKIQLVTPDLVDIVPNSMCPTEIEAIIYNQVFKDPFSYSYSNSSNVFERFILWTDENYAITQRQAGASPLTAYYEDVIQENNEENRNPYGLIPFVVSRTSVPKDYILTESGRDLINLQDGINRLILQINELCLLQSFSILVLSGDSKIHKGEMRISPGTVVTLDANDKLEQPQDLKYITPSSKIQELIQTLEKKIELYCYIYGISPSDFKVSGTPASGYSLRIQNRELERRFTKEKVFYEMLEKKVFNVVKAIWNFESKKVSFGQNSSLRRFKGVQFSDTTELNTVCNAPQYPEEPAEMRENYKWLFENKLKTPVDYYIEQEGMTEEEAQQAYEANKDWFDEYMPPPANPFEDEGKGVSIGNKKDDGREEIEKMVDEKQKEEEEENGIGNIEKR